MTTVTYGRGLDYTPPCVKAIGPQSQRRELPVALRLTRTLRLGVHGRGSVLSQATEVPQCTAIGVPRCRSPQD